jgi:hypothetical protein
MIDGRLVFVNQYYNFPTEFHGEKGGQFVQALRQLGLSRCFVENRFEISPLAERKRLHETSFPPRVEVGNKVSEVRKHFLPRLASEILLRVNALSKKFGGNIDEL